MPRSILLAILAVALLAGSAVRADVRINDRSADSPGSMQVDPSLAASGDSVFAVWTHNDDRRANYFTVRCAFSVDAGATFTQWGSPPVPVGWNWIPNARAGIDPTAHRIYLAGRGFRTSSPRPNVLLFVAGTIQPGPTIVWDTPRILDYFVDNSFILLNSVDMRVRPSDGRVVIAYSTEDEAITLYDSLRVISSVDAGVTWSASALVDRGATSDEGVGVPRIAFGPSGRIDVAWIHNNWTNQTLQTLYNSANSTNSGKSFSSFALIQLENTAATPYLTSAPRGAANGELSMELVGDPYAFANGKPTFLFDRQYDYSSIPLPSLLSPQAQLAETTATHDTTTSAQPIPPNVIVRGDLSASVPYDIDFYSLPLLVGDRLVAVIDSSLSTLPPLPYQNLRISIVGPDQRTVLAAATSTVYADLGSVSIAFTAPVAGTYYVRVTADPSSGTHGPYRLRVATATGALTGPRDTDDIYMSGQFAFSNVWSTPSLLLAGEGAGFDDGLVNGAYGMDGRLYLSYNDWTAVPGSAQMRRAITRPTLVGPTEPVGFLSSSATSWMDANVLSTVRMLGEQDDLVCSGNNLYAAWVDGRDGDPDVYLGVLPLDFDAARTTPSPAVTPGMHVTLTANVNNHNPLFVSSASQAVAVSRKWFVLFGNPLTMPAGGATPATLVFTVPDSAKDGPVTITQTFKVGRITRSCTWNLVVVRQLSVSGGSSAFALHAPAPDPAVVSTRLSFVLAEDAPARLDIFDVSGRHVRTLVLGSLTAGPHEAEWDTRDDRGAPAGTGLYLVRLSVPGRTATQRLVLSR